MLELNTVLYAKHTSSAGDVREVSFWLNVWRKAGAVRRAGFVSRSIKQSRADVSRAWQQERG